MRMKGLTGIELLVLAVIALIVAPMLGINLQAITGGIGGAQPSVSMCPDTKSSNLDVRVKNALNSTEDYNLGTPTNYIFSSAGEEVTRAATTGAAYKSNAVPCPDTYDVYIGSVNSMLGAGVNSYAVKGVVVNKQSVQKNIEVNQMGYPSCKLLDVNFANLTAPSGASQSSGFMTCQASTIAATTDAQTFGQGDSYTYHLQFQINSSGQYGAFGSNDPALNTYLCFDFNAGAMSKSNGVVVAGATAMSAVPSGGPSNDGFDKCYVVPALKSTDGIRDYTLTLWADLGNPGSSDDVTARLYDEQWFVGANGQMKTGTLDDASADVGATNVGLTIQIA